MPTTVGVAGEAAAEPHPAALVGLGNLPGPAALEPFVGDLHLPAALDQLVEDAELVADAVAHRRYLQAGQRLQEAGRQPAQAAVPQARLLLHRQDLLDIAHAEAAQGLAGGVADAQHQQVVAQLGTDQELGREVGHHPGGLLAQGGVAGQLAGHQPVAHRQAEGLVEIVGGGAAGPAAEAEEQVLGDRLEQVARRQTVALGVAVAGGFRDSIQVGGASGSGLRGGGHGSVREA
jgi:hypothetical protein